MQLLIYLTHIIINDSQKCHKDFGGVTIYLLGDLSFQAPMTTAF